MPARRLLLRDAVRTHRHLVLGTCVVIQEHREFRLLREIPREQRRVSILTVYEFYHRRDGSSIAALDRRERERWLDDQGIIPLQSERAVGTSFMALVGKPIAPPGVVDCYLAADCIARRSPLVTNNVRHFEQVEGLILVPV